MIEITEEDLKAAAFEAPDIAQASNSILVGAELMPFIQIIAERNVLRRVLAARNESAGG